MPRSKFIDFKAVKAAFTMEQALGHYALLDGFKRSGHNLSGPCPIHKGSNPTQFRVSISKNIWNCFSECKHGGNTLDFIAEMENVSIHAAALKAIEWFQLDPESMSAPDNEAGHARESRGEALKSEPAAKANPKHSAKANGAAQAESNTPNPTLKFRLEKLDAKHPYFAERGIADRAIAEFGLGYCAKGIMAERIAIPIENIRGELVAYAGRLPSEPSTESPKYKLPPGFKKSQEVFNLHRAVKEPVENPLVIVEGFFDAIKLWQNGCRKVVALMGSTMSAAQAKLIIENAAPTSAILVMLDEDEAGRAGRDDIASRLSRFFFVKVHVFPKDGGQPEQLTCDEVAQLLGGSR